MLLLAGTTVRGQAPESTTHGYTVFAGGNVVGREAVTVQQTAEGTTISADYDPLYVRFVSDAAGYGADLGRWTQLFTNAFSLALSAAIAPGLTASRDLQDAILEDADRALSDARSKDALQGPPGAPPAGRWARARRGGGSMSRVAGGWRNG